MAVELLTCQACGDDWTRRISHGTDPAADVCPACAPSLRRAAPTAPAAFAVMVTDRPRHDPDIPIAFASVAVTEALTQGPRSAVCPWCGTGWLADATATACPGCGSGDGRVVVPRSRPADHAPAAAPDDVPLEENLASLPGVGPAIARRVVARWPDLDAIAGAEPSDLIQVRGIGTGLACRIIEHARARNAPPETEVPWAHPFAALDGTGDEAAAPVESVTYDQAWTDALDLFDCVVCTGPVLDIAGRAEHPLCPNCDTGSLPGRNHGLRSAKRGCRCGTCLDAYARGREWVTERVAGRTLEAIGDEAGITRERVRQVTEKVEPSRPWDAATRVARSERDEVATVAEAALASVQAAATDPCPTCGGTVAHGGNRRFCTPDCRERFDILRYHIDEERRAAHRVLMARWTLDHPERNNDLQIRYAERVMEGTAVHDDNRRWLIEGSAPFKVAVEAVVNGWPLADLLPGAVRRQIDTHLGRGVHGWEEILTADVLAAEYVDARQTASQIARKFGCTNDDVYDALERHDIPLRTSSSPSETESVLTREFLEREYLDNGRSGADIAEEVGCDRSTVYAALRRHGLPVTPQSGKYDHVLTREFLEREYVDNGRSGADIAQAVGCNPSTIYAALHRHGIDTGARQPSRYSDVLTEEYLRREYVDNARSGTDIAEEVGCARHAVYAALRRHGIDVRDGTGFGGRESWGDVLTEEFLRREYVDREKSGNQIAEESGVNPSVVYAWLERHGIDRRQTTADLPYTEEWLREQYLDEGRPASELAEEVGLSVPGLYAALRKYGIRRDDRPSRSVLTRELLLREYVENGRDVDEIAAANAVDRSTVYAALRRHGIPLRG